MKYIEKIPHIILSVIFAATFLTIFYFTYVCKVEKDIVHNQIIFLTDNMYSEMLDYLPGNMIEKLGGKIASIKRPDLSLEDDAIKKQNREIFIKTIKSLAILDIIGLSVSFLIARYHNVNFIETLLNNLLILCFIAGTELAFLKIFIVDYISVDPNIIKLQILNKLFK